jgi:hypothetical protein
MKINKLKTISISFCCLVTSLWSEAQCMDNQPDILESATVNRTSNIQPVAQSEINDVAFEVTPSQLINLEDSQDSWASYLISPLKSTIQVANEFVKLATNNPKLATVVGMCYVLPAVAALASDPIIGGWFMQATCHKTPHGSSADILCDGYKVHGWLGWTSEPIIYAGPTHGFPTQAECEGRGNICDLGPRSGYVDYHTPYFESQYKYKEFGCEWVMPTVYIWKAGNATYYNCVRGIFK